MTKCFQILAGCSENLQLIYRDCRLPPPGQCQAQVPGGDSAAPPPSPSNSLSNSGMSIRYESRAGVPDDRFVISEPEVGFQPVLPQASSFSKTSRFQASARDVSLDGSSENMD